MNCAASHNICLYWKVKTGKLHYSELSSIGVMVSLKHQRLDSYKQILAIMASINNRDNNCTFFELCPDDDDDDDDFYNISNVSSALQSLSLSSSHEGGSLLFPCYRS